MPPPGTQTASNPGLSSAQAAAKLEAEGPNQLPRPPGTPWWRRLAAEMVHFFALLFWAAGGLAFVAGLPQLGIAIFVVVVLNGVFAFAQEERAQHAAEGLRRMLPRQATVLRDGRPQVVGADQLVVDDVVLLSEGDRISADASVIEASTLSVDTSAMTGESVPEHPCPSDTVFAGCFVVEGQGRVRVTATGARTRLAGIATLASARRFTQTPLRRELTRVSRLIALVAIAVGASFYCIALLVGMPPSDGLLFAVGVTVALVPEGLLPTVTLSLAMGAQRMAHHHALVRHLEAVQTLGSTTFICTDKTGTLTQNRMAVVEVWTPHGSATIEGVGYEPSGTIRGDSDDARWETRRVAMAAARCSSGRIELVDGAWLPRGDPMDAAVDALTRRVGVQAVGVDDDAVVQRFSFDARRRRTSVVAGRTVMVKGAPDAILPLCQNVPGAADALGRLARRGLRVLAVATRELGEAEDVPSSPDAAECDLELLGLLAFEDPPRPGVGDVMAQCRRAGIRVAMITGDHPATAEAIAREAGLSTGRTALLASELPTDPGELGDVLDHDGLVVARVDPETKLSIARALQRRGHVVAMTGDGVNDAPALREAAIGVAMGKSGTDVAREAADVVLLDDDFGTIVTAIEQGRSTFANIRRFLTYHLAGNVAELTPFVVWALSGGNFPLAIGVLQVLALDIGTDVFPALALGAEPPDERTLDKPPVRGHLLDGKLLFRAFAVLGAVEAVVAMAAFVGSFVIDGWRPGMPFPTGHALMMASGAAFVAIVLGQAANAFACRSTTRPAWAVSLRSNPLLIAAVAAELLVLACLLLVERSHGCWGTRRPVWLRWRLPQSPSPWSSGRTQSTSGSSTAAMRTTGPSVHPAADGCWRHGQARGQGDGGPRSASRAAAVLPQLGNDEGGVQIASAG
ncbi:cation-translocating P-type ATPase [Mycolicibacterium lacusdiani]|uniref:cation-translocating P-type ATPase n=1 Tax=Mycolicibacterium lacusdiani TaxID=2895283 RepID=UPI0027E063A3|nr:cation-transporting P-type ATPase [Mycolicibacterium lacusdiani]